MDSGRRRERWAWFVRSSGSWRWLAPSVLGLLKVREKRVRAYRSGLGTTPWRRGSRLPFALSARVFGDACRERRDGGGRTGKAPTQRQRLKPPIRRPTATAGTALSAVPGGAPCATRCDSEPFACRLGCCEARRSRSPARRPLVVFPVPHPMFPDPSRIARRDHLPSTDDHRMVVRT